MKEDEIGTPYLIPKDANGTQLQVGDKVILVATIRKLVKSGAYFNADMESDLGRLPNNETVPVKYIQTAVLVKLANSQEAHILAKAGA